MPKSVPSLPPPSSAWAPHRFVDAQDRHFEVRPGHHPQLWKLTESYGEQLDGLLGRPPGPRSRRTRLDPYPLKRSIVWSLLAEILRLVAELRKAHGPDGNGMDNADAN